MRCLNLPLRLVDFRAAKRELQGLPLCLIFLPLPPRLLGNQLRMNRLLPGCGHVRWMR